jgi:hypothetical protein
MRRLIPVLAVLFIALACCVESDDDSGEKIIGESIREDYFVNRHMAHARDEVIIGPGETVKAFKNVTEPLEGMFFFGGGAKLRFVLKYPNGTAKEWTRPHGGWYGDRGIGIKDTGTLEVSVTNMEKKPAYLWYNLYLVPSGTLDEVLEEEYDRGNGPGEIYLILS